jgi:DNA-binding NtrC family response regulator
MERKSILIVDDDETTPSSLNSLMASDAVKIETASTMEEAEARLKTETFDLVITDLRLTGTVGMEGFELISKIKAQTPQTRVVLLTGYGSPEIEQEARQRGADDYWEKTILIPTLVERIRALGIPVGHEREGNNNGFAALNGK